MLEVVIGRHAIRRLRRVPAADARRIQDKVRQYSASPESLVNQVKRLQGSPYLRLHVGDYRVIFETRGKTMIVLDVGHRKGVYQ